MKFPHTGFNTAIVDAIPNIVMVLNECRQVIYANKALYESWNMTEEDVLGRRPGELLSCIHAFEHEAGCGTTEFCSQCGAINAILSSQQGIPDVRECRVTQRSGVALDLRVWATPYDLNGERYTIFTLSDISDEKRRRALERIFFHDLLNTTCSLQFTSYMLKTAPAEESEELVEKIILIAEALNEEIAGQRTITNAESNELDVQISLFSSSELLSKIAKLYSNFELTKNHPIVILPSCEEVVLSSDLILMKRVIGNMIKNALEACRPGDTVTMGCEVQGTFMQFWVHNPGFIPREVQLQIFQRSFSTKGRDRGLGTYSIKLLTERYLKGSVAFTSTPADGTRFTITVPINLEG
jgi:signal transduction histidine kinase